MMAPQLQQGSDRLAQSSAGSAPTLRPYQTAAIASAQVQLAQFRSTLVVAATGTGKTVTFAELARMEKSRGGKTLILVHRDELIRQALRKLEAVGLHADVEKGSQRANTLAKVVVASVQTLKGKRLARWARAHFTLIIVDEAHHAVANSYRGVLDYFDAAKIVGVTATPDRADGKALGEVFESVAYRYEIKQAIADEYLVPIVARRIVVESVDLSTVATRAGDLAQDQLAAVMADERALRGAAVPLLELARDRQTIGFCVDVAHAVKMTAVMNSYRPGCARSVSGETDEDEREELLEAFQRREFQFLFNCDVLTEGFDAPVCSCVVMLRPTKSRGRFVQCGGRGLRLLGDSLAESARNGKRDCLILDITGTAGKHKLVGPADCLAGSGELADDVREEIDRLLGTAQLELDAVIDQAEDEVAKRRAAMRVQAVVSWRSQYIDLFIDEDAVAHATQPARPEWSGEAASPKQLEALEAEGVVVAKLPQLTRAEAWDMLVRIKSRRRRGLCSYKMAKRLHSLGWPDTRNLTQERALQLRDKCLVEGWHPATLADEPEVRAAREARRGVA